VAPSGFATAMQKRDRRKKEPAESFQERYPGVEKIELAELSIEEQEEHLRKIQEKFPVSNRKGAHQATIPPRSKGSRQLSDS
jgi:hypothetical protein